jgi:hypothetical protein
MALFLFDMALDDDENFSFSGPIAILVITILGTQITRLVFQTYRTKRENILEQSRNSSITDINKKEDFGGFIIPDNIDISKNDNPIREIELRSVVL